MCQIALDLLYFLHLSIFARFPAAIYINIFFFCSSFGKYCRKSTLALIHTHRVPFMFSSVHMNVLLNVLFTLNLCNVVNSRFFCFFFSLFMFLSAFIFFMNVWFCTAARSDARSHMNLAFILNPPTHTHIQDNTHTKHQPMDMLRNRNEITARTIQSNIKRWTDDAIHHPKSM